MNYKIDNKVLDRETYHKLYVFLSQLQFNIENVRRVKENEKTKTIIKIN